MSDATSDAQPQQQSSLAYGWLTVGLLTIAYVFSFIDRYVLGLLIEPVAGCCHKTWAGLTAGARLE